MLLCLDIGNSQMYGGVFQGNDLKLKFRHSINNNITSDQLGIFLKSVLKENSIDPEKIKNIAACLVVPSIDHPLKSACIKYFSADPFFITSEIQAGITININQPEESGTDIIAGSIAALHAYPKKNIIIVDFGTATTITAITANQEYIGTTIIPGIRTAMNSLQSSTSKLFLVEIVIPTHAIGRSTTESIQAGLYFGHIGAIKEITNRIKREVFPRELPILIATGGFSSLFEQEKIFNYIDPELVLKGIKIGFEKSKNG